ncbi:MAG: NUDIX domain-containing protein [Actinobacteria bacterium]|nr:NUDIX domain-containing protein [Actinomycetota bacterium]
MEPAPLRPAATLVVARGAAAGSGAGVEILALERAPGAGVLPGFVVFPGGTLDAGDRALARRWFGTEEEAARACAVRELAEEASLALTGRGLRAVGDVRGALGAVDAWPPDPAAIPEIARWVAPDILPTRFDARFFAAAAPRGLEPSPDGTEIGRAWWSTPGDLLEAFRRGEAPLAWPTLKTLEALRGCGSVDDVLGLRVEQAPAPGTDRGPPPRAEAGGS